MAFSLLPQARRSHGARLERVMSSTSAEPYALKQAMKIVLRETKKFWTFLTDSKAELQHFCSSSTKSSNYIFVNDIAHLHHLASNAGDEMELQ